MIVPFIMTLLTINMYPYLWFFYKSLDMAKKKGWPIIAQEKYFEKPSSLLKRNDVNSRLIEDEQMVNRQFIYELPVDEDLEKIQQYSIPLEMENRLIKAHGSVNDAFVYILRNSWQELEDLLDSYFTEITATNEEKIEAVVTLFGFPSLYNAAKKHNISVLAIEQGPFREPSYRKTAYFTFSEIFDEKAVEKRYGDFKKKVGELPILSRKEILSILLTDESLAYLKFFHQIPRFEIGVALGYTTWLPHMTNTYCNDEELLYTVSRLFDNYIIRKHPGDPAGASYRSFHPVADSSRTTIEFILKCKRIASLSSNVSLEAAYWNRSPYTLLNGTSSYGLKNDLNDKEEYSVDIEYLNFFAFCYLVPYKFMMDPEYIRWRLSCPAEEELFKKHLEYYLEDCGCSYETLTKLTEETRLEYILKQRGCNNLNDLNVRTSWMFAPKPKPKVNIPDTLTQEIISDNKRLTSEINRYIETEKRYESAFVDLTNEQRKLKAAYNSLQEQQKRTADELNRTKAIYNQVQANNENVIIENNELKAAYENLQAEHKAVFDELNRVKSANTSLQEQYEAMLDRQKYLENDYNRIINSQSWKITKPIRVSLDLIKKGFKKK